MENTPANSLKIVNKNSIWSKVKQFFKGFFIKKKRKAFNNVNLNKNEVENNIQKEQFMKYIKNIEGEDIKLLKLQQRYRNGEITEQELSQEEIKALCDLYDKQIEKLQKSNNSRKEKIKKFKEKQA